MIEPEVWSLSYLTLRAKCSRTAVSTSSDRRAKRLQCQLSTKASTRERPSAVSDPDVKTPRLMAPDLARRRLPMKFCLSGSDVVKTCGDESMELTSTCICIPLVRP